MSEITWSYGPPGEVKTQADQRTDMLVPDQFGRQWLYQMENKTMDPTGLIDRVKWSDPLNTPQKYLVVPRNRRGRPQLELIEVQLGRWIEDQHHALQAWRDNVYAIAQQKFPGLTTVEQMESHPVIRRLAGPKPWPSVEALERAAAGQPCLLGQAPIWQNVRTEIAMGRAVVKREPVMTPEAIEARALLEWSVPEDAAVLSGQPVTTGVIQPASVELTLQQQITALQAENAALKAGAGPVTGGRVAVGVGGGGSPSAPETWPQFAGRVMASGEAKNRTEAGALWKARKSA